MESRQLTAGPEQEGLRCDAFVADCLPEISRSAAQRLAEQGLVTRQGVALNKKDKIKAGDQIQVCLPDPAPAQAVAQPIPLDIRWEDEDVIVINKPAGMVVHPAAGNPDGTLVNALLAHCGPSLSGIGGELRPGIVHRIDKDTSGLLIVAKNCLLYTSQTGPDAVGDPGVRDRPERPGAGGCRGGEAPLQI